MQNGGTVLRNVLSHKIQRFVRYVIVSTKAEKSWLLYFLGLIFAITYMYKFTTVDKYVSSIINNPSIGYAAIMNGTAVAPAQYRPLVPTIVEIMHIGGIFSYSFCILILEAAGLLLTLVTFHLLLRTWFDPALSGIGVSFLAFFIVVMFEVNNSVWYSAPHPPDIFGIWFLLLLFMVVVKGRDTWAIPALAIGLLNREVILLFVPIYIWWKWKEGRYNRFVSLGLIGTAIVIPFVLRLIYGVKSTWVYSIDGIVIDMTRNLTIDLPLGFIVSTMGWVFLSILLVFKNPGSIEPGMKYMLFAALLYLLSVFTLGIWSEVRLFLPFVTLSLPAVMALIGKRHSNYS